MGIDLVTVLFFVGSLIPGFVLHELSHGVAADRFGDPTPRAMGRITLNPARHADPFGSVILPGLLLLPWLLGNPSTPVFAYAKPMPVNPSNLREPDRQMMWIALVGPLTNLALAAAGAALYRLAGEAVAADPGRGGLLARFVVIFVFTNVFLAVFNLLPIPPLDGSRVLARFLPARARQVYASLEPYGALFLLLIFFLIPGIVSSFVQPIVEGIFRLLVG